MSTSMTPENLATSAAAGEDDAPAGSSPVAPVGTASTGHRVALHGLGKRYGTVEALAGIDLDIAPGTFVVLLGPSGSGKSTLIRSLAGVERPDSGRIEIGGATVSGPRLHLPPERRDLAMVFQDYALWPHLTALGNVSFALRRRKLPTDEVRRRVHQALDQVGLDGLAGRYPHELSGGQQQRVALARAIVARPGLLLFDEPLSNLDSDLRERLRVQISTLVRDSGATAVYITHDQGEAFALADVVGVLDHGRLVQLAPPETVYQQPATPFVARFTGISAELRGTVQTVVGSWAELQVAGATRVAARHLGTVVPGQEVTVLVRPSATRIAAPGDAGPALEGTVVDVAYRGRGYDHVVEVGPGADKTLITSVAHPTGLRRGELVRLALDPEGCMAFPAATATSDVTP
jgi:ABC-type Fe3+/spermidine/putrescine transport system ATPase subunit